MTDLSQGDSRLCPDDGTCHHDCDEGYCFRVEYCEPLTAAGWGDRWPTSIRRIYGDLWNRQDVAEIDTDPLEKTYVLTLHDCPKSVNAGGGGSRVHWSKAHTEKRQWEGRYALELMAAKVPRNMHFCHIEVTVRWKHRNRRDSTNYFQPIFKPLLDALTKGGWLEDDTDEWVGVAPIKFEYPEVWGIADPRCKCVMIVKLEASYR
jgi:hypothetical protein